MTALAYKRRAVPEGAASIVPTYHGDGSDRCPGCGRQHWIVGRYSVECAFCSSVMMLKDGSRLPVARDGGRG